MKILIVTESTDLESNTVEDLFLARQQLKTIDEGYQEIRLDTPEWITDKLSEVDREITFRVKAELQRKLRQAKARRTALKTADEKRTDLDAEIAALEGKLK